MRHSAYISVQDLIDRLSKAKNKKAVVVISYQYHGDYKISATNDRTFDPEDPNEGLGAFELASKAMNEEGE